MASALSTKDAPAALGPYSQAVKLPAASELIFVSGQIPLTPNGVLVSGTIAEELATALSNVQAILKEAGATLENVVKSTVFLSDMEYFGEANEEYLRWFTWDLKPARSCVAVKQLPKNARVEVECIARI
ncbi:2-iminobutanoate/2-iminopropanoate deaminase [Penicillium taxi]|uniref:2-iminobutanoate/2-iminopropanoate deaminase n=1 Tax=Penicillium taxi TaxID=168475 RepID=UPI0025451CF3|nr:2-iminobutanoate/2-iminopropanoate deaminase [Penicillium taxi]KAJ5895506.1 2-iminobutanoate/2-iminopropanoate deaminase [Penicillium taxi]